jgi:hypothetical protein
MVEGSVSLTTPFTQLQEFEIGGNHEMNKKKLAFSSIFLNKYSTGSFLVTDVPINVKLS